MLHIGTDIRPPNGSKPFPITWKKVSEMIYHHLTHGGIVGYFNPHLSLSCAIITAFHAQGHPVILGKVEKKGEHFIWQHGAPEEPKTPPDFLVTVSLVDMQVQFTQWQLPLAA